MSEQANNRPRSAWAGFVLGIVLSLPSLAGAQPEVPLLEDAPVDGSQGEVTTEGLPEQSTDPERGVAEVEAAMDEAEEEMEQGLPEEFLIRFGDTFDWLRLTSGEWLKGTLRRLRDDRIEFDSDKLDLLEFDWEDVERLHCPEVNAYVFEGKLDVVGRALVTEDKVLIEDAEGVKEYRRADLLSIVDGAPRERNWWSSKLGVGFSANAGNTEQGSLTAYFQLTRADYRTRMRLRYDGTVGYANGEENVNRHLGTAAVRLYISRRWYFIPGGAAFLNDRFQNIRFRATPGASAGLHVFDTDRVTWDLEAGLGYQYLESASAAVGQRNPQNDGFVSVGTWAEFELADDVTLTLEWQTNFVYTTIGNTNHTGRAEFSVGINDIFDFETSLLFLRTEEPLQREDGTTPAKNDYQVVVSLAFDID